ncbi:hypothetical protein [Alteromonas sp. KUL49]|uniref:hypothetical protein n=1 Tax=Alteromonas sp. KUL49 TaxID=2480798 RepID=UPI00102EE545|nr:hypothetical protein [Alteromonas sp. KUL49]TAP39047.1 hypothetical protein EYS00_14260 [Alteromonas sp. KUL49]GEA12504.1 hypothetical protein KUL49_28790 [Alteromonas sp. KUL49]
MRLRDYRIVHLPLSLVLYASINMNIDLEIIEDIIQLASARREVVTARVGNKEEYSQKDLVAKSNIEVELFDSMDSLSPLEFATVFKIALNGGLKGSTPSMQLPENIDMLYLEINLDTHLKLGLELLKETSIGQTGTGI